MAKQKSLDQKIIEVFNQQFGRWMPKMNGSLLFQGDGFMDLVLSVSFEANENLLISLGHYFLHNKAPYPDPCMHFRILKNSGMVKPLIYRNSIQFTNVAYVRENKDYVESDLKQFLYMWLNNILMQGYSPSAKKLDWKRQPQEKSEAYTFSGRLMITNGVLDTLHPADLYMIMMDLEAFILAEKNGDYLQVYKSPTYSDSVYCIDQLSESMKASGDYSPDDLKAYDYHTILLASEY